MGVNRPILMAIRSTHAAGRARASLMYKPGVGAARHAATETSAASKKGTLSAAEVAAAEAEAADPPGSAAMTGAMAAGGIGAVGLALLGGAGALGAAAFVARATGRTVADDDAGGGGSGVAAVPAGGGNRCMELEDELWGLRKQARSPEVDERKRFLKDMLKLRC